MFLFSWKRVTCFCTKIKLKWSLCQTKANFGDFKPFPEKKNCTEEWNKSEITTDNWLFLFKLMFVLVGTTILSTFIKRNDAVTQNFTNNILDIF